MRLVIEVGGVVVYEVRIPSPVGGSVSVSLQDSGEIAEREISLVRLEQELRRSYEIRRDEERERLWERVEEEEV